MDPASVHSDRLGQSVLSDLHGPEEFHFENLAGVNGWQFLGAGCHGLAPVLVVHDLYQNLPAFKFLLTQWLDWIVLILGGLDDLGIVYTGCTLFRVNPTKRFADRPP